MSWQLAALTLVLLSFGLVLYYSISSGLHRSIDVALEAEAESVLSSVDFQGEQVDLGQVGLDFDTAGLFIQISDTSGSILARSSNLGSLKIPLGDALLKQVTGQSDAGLFKTITTTKGGNLRLFTRFSHGDADTAKSFVVQVATSLGPLERALLHLRFWLFIIAPVLLFVFGLGSFLLSRRLLHPLKQMAQTAERISDYHLSERLPVVNPDDEIGQVAHTLNRMFDRVGESFQSQRRFVADASHELRTPIAVLQTKLEVTLRRLRTCTEYRDVIQMSLDHAQRLSMLVDQLSFLARSDAGSWRAEMGPVRVDKICLEQVREFKAQADTMCITLQVECAQPVIVLGEPELLRRLLINLLENAMKYTPKGGTVRLGLKRDGAKARLVVSDTGMGIPPDDLPHVFDRFYRVDRARSRRIPGTGLGLSLVEEIARMHGGSVTVESVVSQGTTFTVSLMSQEMPSEGPTE